MEERDFSVSHEADTYLKSLVAELTREERALLRALAAAACGGGGSPLQAMALQLHGKVAEVGLLAHALQKQGLVSLLPDGENDAALRARITLLGKRVLPYLP